MAFATNNNLHTYTPEVFESGVDDWSDELALAETDVVNTIRIRWWNKYETPSQFDSSKLTDSQWTRTTVYKALYSYILPKLSTFRPEGDPFQTQITFYKERFEEGKEDEQENVEDQDQRGWVYVLWCPAYPTWVVTGKAKNFRDRINGYQTYSPNRDYELVGLAYVENRKEGEEKLQDEIDKEHTGKRGKASNKPSEWFEINKEQAYEILERLNPETTFKNHPEQD